MRLENHTDACRQVDELARHVPHAIAAVHHPLVALGAERMCASPAYPDGIHVADGDAGVISNHATQWRLGEI